MTREQKIESLSATLTERELILLDRGLVAVRQSNSPGRRAENNAIGRLLNIIRESI